MKLSNWLRLRGGDAMATVSEDLVVTGVGMQNDFPELIHVNCEL